MILPQDLSNLGPDTGPMFIVHGSRDALAQENLAALEKGCNNLARHLDVDAEKALTGANYKFERRFRAMEAAIEENGIDIRELGLEILEQRWLDAKKGVG